MGAVRFKVVEQDGQELVKEIHKVTVYQFRVGDVEDPDLYAAEPLWKWQESEQGKFVMEHAVDKPIWHRRLDTQSYGHEYAITAELESKKLSEFYLKWGKNGSGKIR
jgi:hypothetical protein